MLKLIQKVFLECVRDAVMCANDLKIGNRSIVMLVIDKDLNTSISIAEGDLEKYKKRASL